MIRVAIIGATGYTASESLRILLRHPQAQATYLTALPEECGPIVKIFPEFRDRLDLEVEPLELAKLSDLADVVLCCLPHKASMGFVPKLLDAGLKVIDFSADYRLRDVAVYEQYYQVKHTDTKNLQRAVFALPELFREKIAGTDLISNPGCYPTCSSLGLAPLVREGLIDLQDIVVNTVSGISGAGRKPGQAFHFPEINENYFAYAVGTHRHMPEIEQILSDVAGKPVNVLFQPHVAPYTRGMLATIYANPTRSLSQAELDELYAETYGPEVFVRLPGCPPQVLPVAGTNFCDVWATTAKGKVVVLSALDNLVKGAAGQAIQNMNIIFGLEEAMGLL
ncbi:MAG: N-acetyl-gamma-glutamyl-phosphate reductase [Phycisphaerae bacterium]|nr:N-acetyl-gamma-glutamyl-phosphate reductase [Phycisphaerae bacterium]